MDNELRLIQYLYSEEEHPEEVERMLAADRTLRDEYRRLKATKDHLDTHAPQRPDATVVDHVVAAAARPSRDHAPAAPRADRAPVMSARRLLPRQRVLGLTSALAALLVLVGVWQWNDGRLIDAVTSKSIIEAPSAVESQEASLAAAAEEAALPAWNEADDELMRLHQYIEALHIRSSPERWDSPGSRGLMPASQMQPAGR